MVYYIFFEYVNHDGISLTKTQYHNRHGNLLV